MKKNLLALLVLLCAITGFSQNIDVNPTGSPYNTADPYQLINNVLVNNACLSQITGESKTTGENYGYALGKSIGYFTNSNPSFPMSAGVVLTTGNANNAEGPNTNPISSFYDLANAWVGDADLEAAFTGAGTGITTMNSMNATVLEFSFVATTNTLSIPYIFASEEYGAFQCLSKDGFAILLKTGSGPYTNIATIPSTTQPVTVATLRNSAYNSTCSSQNFTYFGNFNGGGAAAASPTNYEGQTVLMTANATLVPGTTYHIKIVIADDGDANPTNANGTDGRYDSAVFFPAGSFNLGQLVVGNNLTTASNTALCVGDSYVINTQLSATTYNLSWKKDGAPTAGGSSITITDTGIYELTITNPATGCTTTESVDIEFAAPLVPGTPNNLYACEDSSGSYTYNLGENTPVIKQNLDPAVVVTYHDSQQNAEQNLQPLNVSYVSPGNQTIWARVKSNNSSCYSVVSFQLLTLTPPVATQPANMSFCETTQNTGTAVFNLTGQNPTILGSQAPANFTVQYFTSLANANANTLPITQPGSYTSATTTTNTSQTIYARVQNNLNPSCYAVTSFTINVVLLPVLATPADVTACNSYQLPALTTGNYYTGSGATGAMLPAGSLITATQTVYIYAATTGTTPVCSNQTSFVVTIVTTASTPADVTACTSYTLPPLPAGQFYYNNANAAGGPPPSPITSSQDVYFYIPAAASCTATSHFHVTIISADDPADVNVCGGSYTLPPLTNGTYHSATGGAANTTLPANYTITASPNVPVVQTIYVYNSSSVANCFVENSFTVTVNNVAVSPKDDVTACGSYTLPTINVGNYYSQSGGNGLINQGALITTTQTVYIYAQSATNPACNSEDSFVITINPQPALNPISNVTACNSYTLPVLPNGVIYYTAADGTGSLGTTALITSTQTIYARTPVNAFGCYRQRQFVVTILGTTAQTPGNQDVCEKYLLPALPAGSYYTMPGGPSTTGNVQLFAGSYITSTQTVYVYAVSNTVPQCTTEGSFVVTVHPLPVFAPIADVVSCTPYTLPNAPSGSTYYTAAGGPGSGTVIANGAVISSTQVIYAYKETGGTPNCSYEDAFTVTIITTGDIAPDDVVACGQYILPEITTAPSANYYSSPNGVGLIPVGTVITTSQTIYVYATTVGTNCTINNSFEVTITNTPIADDPADVTACNSYILPSLTNGSYYSAEDGVGFIPVGTPITTTQTIYVYNSSPGCAAQHDFKVTIQQIAVANVTNQTVCETGYQLPVLTVGQYYTQSGGPTNPNAQLIATPVITTSQTIYVYAALSGTTCFDEKNFTVTVIPAPAVDAPADVSSCDSYTLPMLTNGEYYTAPGKGGNHYLPGQVITSTQDIYVYAETGGTPNCTAENMFTVTVNPEKPADVTTCDQYILPALPAGQHYYTSGSGGAPEILAGTAITTTQNIYFYVPTAAACTADTFFTVTVSPTPHIPAVANVSVCDSYTVPALPALVPAISPVNYNYYTLPGGPSGGGQIIAVNTVLTTSQTVYLYAYTDSSYQCFDQKSFVVTITPTPIVDARSDVEVCGSYTLGDISPGNHYYSLAGGPSTPGQVEYFTGDPISSSDVIFDMNMFIYTASATNPLCVAESSFHITLYHIIADDPADVVQCDSYTLPDIDEGADDGLDVAYNQHYYTLTGGQNVVGQTILHGGDVITSTTTLYVRKELLGRISCFEEHPVTITIYQTPDVLPVNDVVVCDSYTVPALPALATPVTGVNYKYYTLPGGPAGGGAIIAAGTVLTQSQDIYLYAYTGTNTCHDEESYNVTINVMVVPEIADFYACESYTLPDLGPNIQYYTQPGGPAGGGTLLSGTLTQSQTVNIYGQSNTVPNCVAESDFVLTVIQKPVGIIPTNLVTCGIDDLGHGMFDLTPALAEALGTQPNVAVTIHYTLADAQFGQNAIGDTANFANLAAPDQTLYIRLESTFVDTCYDIVDLQLHVNPRPIATEPTDYELCDDGSSDVDGISTFDLTTKDAEVLGTIDPTLFTVTYLDPAGFVIGTPASYNSTTATISAVVTNNATGCFDTVTLELIVNPLPVANAPAPYSLCDVNQPGGFPDEQEVFDLTTKIDEITTGVTGVNATFYHNLTDAQLMQNQIGNPSTYTNLSAVDPIFIRITDNDTGCYRIVLLDVRVEPLPVLVPPTVDDLTVCDTDGDGYANFDLSALVPDLTTSSPNIVVKFYQTLIGAQNDLANSLITNTANFINSVPFQQNIYVTATNTLTGCVSNILTITLVVKPAPQVPDLADLVLCDDTDADDQNNMAYFDLTQQDAIIHAALDADFPGGITIEYFINELYANAGTPKITVPEHYNGTGDQTIWVRVEDPVYECYSITSFDLIINKPVDVVHPAPIALCNEALPNDGKTLFDLTIRTNEILGPNGLGANNVVTFYANQADFNAGTAIANPTSYENATNPQTVYVGVVTPLGCKSFETLTIKVLQLPTPDTTPNPLVKCDDDTPGNLEESFDLTGAAVDILDGGTLQALTYYTTQAAAEAGDQTVAEFIATPTAYVSATGSVWVRVTNTGAQLGEPACYQVVELQLIVNPLPAIGATGTIEPYAICEPLTDGFAEFNLIGYISNILGSSNPADYTVKFYFDAAAVAAGTALPYVYTNQVANHQIIQVYIKNNTTLCDVLAPLDLYVEEAAIAYPIVTNAVIQNCDYDGTNDGYYTSFDLTPAGTEALGIQNPATFSVEYYTTEAAAEAGDITAIEYIATPATFTNDIIYDQTIWVRITNTATISKCHDVTSFAVHVELLPNPVISTVDGNHTICVDFKSGNLQSGIELLSGITPAGHTFTWYRDGAVVTDASATSGTYVPLEPGMYTVIVTGPAPNDCVSEESLAFEVIRSGQASKITTKGYVVSNAFSDEQVITVLVEGYGEYEYSLYPDGPWQNSNVFSNVTRGMHKVYVRDTKTANPCDVLIIDEVSIIDYPNFFTPNGDGYNDYWNIVGLGSTEARIYIFDRYGKLIKQLSPNSDIDQEEGWDGTYNGNPLPADDYWFTVTYPDASGVVREYKSHFAMKR